jgi:hypothetical protein
MLQSLAAHSPLHIDVQRDGSAAVLLRSRSDSQQIDILRPRPAARALLDFTGAFRQHQIGAATQPETRLPIQTISTISEPDQREPPWAEGFGRTALSTASRYVKGHIFGSRFQMRVGRPARIRIELVSSASAVHEAHLGVVSCTL